MRGSSRLLVRHHLSLSWFPSGWFWEVLLKVWRRRCIGAFALRFCGVWEFLIEVSSRNGWGCRLRLAGWWSLVPVLAGLDGNIAQSFERCKWGDDRPS